MTVLKRTRTAAERAQARDREHAKKRRQGHPVGLARVCPRGETEPPDCSRA